MIFWAGIAQLAELRRAGSGPAASPFIFQRRGRDLSQPFASFLMRVAFPFSVRTFLHAPAPLVNFYFGFDRIRT